MSYENEMILQMKLSWDIVHILGQKILGGWGCGYIHLGATSSNNEIWIEILKDLFFLLACQAKMGDAKKTAPYMAEYYGRLLLVNDQPYRICVRFCEKYSKFLNSKKDT